MSTEQKLREALEELLYAHTDKAVAMARAALSLPATEKASAGSEPVGRVRIDSGEVHIVPFVRDAEISDLRAGQQVHAAQAAQPEPQRVGLSEEQIATVMLDADWPQSMLQPIIKRKLRQLVREVERAHGIKDPT